jgi:hypothetical protein
MRADEVGVPVRNVSSAPNEREQGFRRQVADGFVEFGLVMKGICDRSVSGPLGRALVSLSGLQARAPSPAG